MCLTIAGLVGVFKINNDFRLVRHLMKMSNKPQDFNGHHRNLKQFAV